MQCSNFKRMYNAMLYMVLKLENFFFVEKIVSVNFVLSCVKFMNFVSKFDIENNTELGHQCSKFYTHVLSQSTCNACSLKILILIFLFKHTTNQNHLKNPQTKFILHFISDEFSFRFTLAIDQIQSPKTRVICIHYSRVFSPFLSSRRKEVVFEH